MRDGNIIQGIYNALMPMLVIIFIVLWITKKSNKDLIRKLEKEKKELIEREKIYTYKIDSLDQEVEMWLKHYKNLQSTYQQTTKNYEQVRKELTIFRGRHRVYTDAQVDSVLSRLYPAR